MDAPWGTPEIWHILREMSSLKHETITLFYIGATRITCEWHKGQRRASRVDVPSMKTVRRGCLNTGTNKIVLAHNHPTINGICDATPSKKDLLATAIYQEALKRERIILLDHIIVAPGGKLFSFKRHNLL